MLVIPTGVTTQRDYTVVGSSPLVLPRLPFNRNLQSVTFSQSAAASRLSCTQLIGSSPPASSWKPLSNSLTHALNGNRSSSGRGLRLAAWNSGSAFLHNRTNEIEALISVHKPHLLVISEARYYSYSNEVLVSIPQYELVHSKTLENNDFKYSRIHVYKHESLVAKVRLDLMDSSVSSI